MKIVSNDGTKANIKVTEAEVQQMIYTYERWIKTLCEENQQLKSVLNEVREYITKDCPWYKDAGVCGTTILRILDKVGVYNE